MRLSPIGIASVALCFVLCSTEAAAQDDTPSVAEAAVVVATGPFSPLLNGALADPLFLPPKGKLYGSGVSSIALESSDDYNAAGARLYASDRHDIGFSHGLAYGLTPHLSLHGSLGYSFNFEDDTTPAGHVARSSSRTFNDTALGLTWRAVDQRRHPFVLDMALNYTPTFFIRNTSLRPVVNASIGIGRAMRALSIQLIGAVTYQPKHSYLDGGAEVEERSTSDYTLALRSQVRFSRVASTNITVNYGLSGDRLTTNQTNDLLLGEYQPAALTLSAGLNYQLIRSRAIIGVAYSRQFQGDSKEAGPDPSQAVFDRNGSGNLVTAKISYALN